MRRTVGRLTSHQFVQMYLDRIEAYDQKGPAINSIITLNKNALAEADKLDAAFKQTGSFVGPLARNPIILKDQVDAAGFPTTLGSILMKDYYPERDAFAIGQLRKAGAIILAKGTLAEFGGGNTWGSLFGATKNPYDLSRTPGGSSGGPGAALAANFATVGVGEEGSGFLRRPSTWTVLWACTRLPVWSAAPECGTAGRLCSHRSARWPGTSAISRFFSIPWSDMTQKIR